MARLGRSAPIVMVSNPLELLASPLRKFEAPASVVDGAQTQAQAAASQNFFEGAPIEVIALFAVLVGVSVAGLFRSSGATVEGVVDSAKGLAASQGLGPPLTDDSLPAETDEPKSKAPMTAEEEMANMSQGEKERKYFTSIADDLSSKRGGDKSQRKKKKNKRK